MNSLPKVTNQSQVEKLNQLVDISLRINSTLELEPLLRKIMDAAAELTNAESASILLIDQKTRELHFMAFSSDSDVGLELRRVPVPLNGSVAGTVVEEDKPIVINDVTKDPRHYRKADDESGFQTHSLLGIPMRIKNRVIGVLEAVNKINADAWTQDDQSFLEILAAQAAIAIENASLVTRLRGAYAELSQLDKMKNDFIAIASHELRTPLGVILGYASFLKDEAQGEASDHAAAVLNSALKMRQIIEDMTNLRYLKIGEGELDFKIFSVADLMRMALGDIRSTAEAQDNDLQVVYPDEKLMVNVDTGKVVMAITNLLNNAVKFTPKNGTIRFAAKSNNTDIWIVVNDQGAGIPKEHLERIFEEFYQVEDHMTRKHNGMGLGLSIARAIVEAHKGRIWATSEGEGKGASFYVSLPLAT